LEWFILPPGRNRKRASARSDRAVSSGFDSRGRLLRAHPRHFGGGPALCARRMGAWLDEPSECPVRKRMPAARRARKAHPSRRPHRGLPERERMCRAVGEVVAVSVRGDPAGGVGGTDCRVVLRRRLVRYLALLRDAPFVPGWSGVSTEDEEWILSTANSRAINSRTRGHRRPALLPIESLTRSSIKRTRGPRLGERSCFQGGDAPTMLSLLHDLHDPAMGFRPQPPGEAVEFGPGRAIPGRPRTNALAGGTRRAAPREGRTWHVTVVTGA
jgi:hypothetical protein